MKIFLSFLLIFSSIISIFCVIPEWNLDKAGEELLSSSSDEYSYTTIERLMFGVYLKMTRKIKRENNIANYTNELYMSYNYDHIIQKEVPFDFVENFYLINDNYIVCPKGPYHPYNFDTGEFIEVNGFKKKGIEYYIKEIKKIEKGKEDIIKIKKFEGEYNNGLRWNGILFGLNANYKCKIDSGNGFVNEFNENGCLLYEGEIKNGLREGRGKLFDQCGRLIYEGELKEGMKDGKGKEYNENGYLIFVGEFSKGIKLKGELKEYNDECELIKESVLLSEGNYEVKKIHKTIKNYENYLL